MTITNGSRVHIPAGTKITEINDGLVIVNGYPQLVTVELVLAGDPYESPDAVQWTDGWCTYQAYVSYIKEVKE